MSEAKTGTFTASPQRTAARFGLSRPKAVAKVLPASSKDEFMPVRRKVGFTALTKGRENFFGSFAQVTTPILRPFTSTVGFTSAASRGGFFCLEAKTGKLVWTVKWSKGVWATPSVVDGKVYIGCADGFMRCLEAKTGKQIWRYKTGARVWGSAAVTDGCVVFGSADGYLYCLEAKRGKLLWRFHAGGYFLSTPCVAGGQICIGNHNGFIYCLGEGRN